MQIHNVIPSDCEGSLNNSYGRKYKKQATGTYKGGTGDNAGDLAEGEGVSA